MGNICSTRDENDMRGENHGPNGNMQPNGKNAKNVFKANPKGILNLF